MRYRDRINDKVSFLQTISGGQGASVESLIWCQGRLFAGGIGGNVVELDLQARKPKVSFTSLQILFVQGMSKFANKICLGCGSIV